MGSKERKNTTRRLLTLTSKHDRFISTYLKAKHPDVYSEADELYTELNKLYPDKRDLRKTIEFLHITSGIKNINEYYYRNRVSKKTEKNHITDNMLLEIPLLNQNTLTNNQNESPMVIPQEINVHTDESPTVIPQEINVHTDESPMVIPQEINVHTDESPTVIPQEINVHTDESPMVIPDKIYEDLLRELRKDPDLHAIFNDFDLSEEDQAIPETVPELENIDDILNIDEQTPLEWELYTLGY